MNNTTVAKQAKTASFLPLAQGILQRQCACGNYTIAGRLCAECAKGKSGIQRKLTIGASNDPLEREADRVADQVLATSAYSTVSAAPPRIQRYAGQMTDGMDTAPASVDRVRASSGRPLEPALRQDMGQRFGHDFSGVRVHTDGRAAASAREVSASAYTVGHNVVFGAGRFAPETHEGRRLLAHELTHVVQQQKAVERSCGQSRLDCSISKVILQRQEEVLTSCDDREPVSHGVADIIKNAYHGDRNTTYQVNELRDAWFHVINQRNQAGGANCCSPELVAAEHYLYARYAVANRDHSPFEMKALIWGYGYFKFLVPRTGICPKSPDTQGSRDWGYRGVDDGATDLFHQELAQNDSRQVEGDQAEAVG